MNIAEKTININNEFVELFENNKQILNENSCNTINEKREKAFQQFKRIGIPDKNNENYKYSDIQSLFNNNYKKQLFPKKIDFDVKQIFTCDIPDLNTEVYLVLNGFYYNNNKLFEDKNGVILGSLAEAAKKYPEIVNKYYSRLSEDHDEGVVSLNTAFAQDGFFFYVPKNVVLEKPFQLVNLLMSDESLMVQHRNLIIIEENSRAELIICDHTLSPHKFLTNGVTEYFTGDNSYLSLTKMQNEHNDSVHLDNNFILQEKNSNVYFNTITIHGGFVRNNHYVTLNGKASNSNIYGLYLSDMNQHIDNFVFVDHVAPDCTSNQLFKGVLDNAATGAFNGKVLVRKDAQKTTAYQTNKTILLTDEAQMFTQPQLEIYADDVKCSHGATIGQLDQEAMFYLRSRGIGKPEARLLLMYAFADDIIKIIKQEPLKERIIDLVDKRLRGELSRCNNCTMNCC